MVIVLVNYYIGYYALSDGFLNYLRKLMSSGFMQILNLIIIMILSTLFAYFIKPRWFFNNKIRKNSYASGDSANALDMRYAMMSLCVISLVIFSSIHFYMPMIASKHFNELNSFKFIVSSEILEEIEIAREKGQYLEQKQKIYTQLKEVVILETKDLYLVARCRSYIEDDKYILELYKDLIVEVPKDNVYVMALSIDEKVMYEE